MVIFRTYHLDDRKKNRITMHYEAVLPLLPWGRNLSGSFSQGRNFPLEGKSYCQVEAGIDGGGHDRGVREYRS